VILIGLDSIYFYDVGYMDESGSSSSISSWRYIKSVTLIVSTLFDYPNFPPLVSFYDNKSFSSALSKVKSSLN